jgi:hypothetical protein
MPGFLVHIGAIINCTHPPGTVTVNTTGVPRVWVNKGAQQVLAIKDLHTVAGCMFQIPVGAGTKPQPCVTVRLEPATRVFVNGEPAAILTPAAICYSAEQIPQGPPNSSPIQKQVVAT